MWTKKGQKGGFFEKKYVSEKKPIALMKNSNNFCFLVVGWNTQKKFKNLH